MKKVMERLTCAAMFAIALFATPSAFSAVIERDDFEGASIPSGYSATGGAGVTVSDVANLATWSPAPSDSAATYPFSGFGDNYLSVDTDTNTLWRTFDEQSSNVQVDAYMQFFTREDDFELPDDAKIVIYLNAETNLCAISGETIGGAVVTNELDVSIEAGSWHRFTLKANSGDNGYSFNILLDGALLSTASGNADTFYSLTDATSSSRFGINGSGAVDNVAIFDASNFEKTNPVTGETETYKNIFIGGASEWNSAGNWMLATESKVPFVSSGDYNAALVDGKTASTSTAIDGWQLRVGAYNGAAVTWSSGITKIQGNTTGCWLTADETSSITIASFAGNQLENNGNNVVFKLTSANAGGITWATGLSSNSGYQNIEFQYYLGGAGTIVYGGAVTVNNPQVIKQADITLSGTSQVTSKTLVTFGSGTKTFTADATIKVKDANGDVVRTVPLTRVTAAEETTLTTDNHVGSCELVQTSTGIVLYYVDGDPENLPVYKPSININFTSGTALSTVADVGVGEYAIPGTSWNNLIGNNGSLNTITGVDSTGVASAISGAKVTISGTRGYWTKGGLDAASDLRQGYIDDNAGNASPQFVVEGIPYDRYKTILYFSNNDDGVKFGYVTVNGLNYKGDLANTTTVTSSGGSEIWGSASPTAYTEGGNYLVIPTQLKGDGSLTVVSHRLTGSRAGLAAVQIVEVVPEAGANDLEIAVDGTTNYAVDAAKTLSGTVYLTGSGTLTLSGSAKITAATIDVGKDVVLNVNADRLDATTFTGAGTVVYNNSAPVSGKGWASSATWTGILWLKNQILEGINPGDFANARSTLRLSLCTGYFNSGNNTQRCDGTLDLDNDTGAYAFSVSNGWSADGKTIFARLTGSGTLGVQSADIGQRYIFKDASEFTGAINIAGRTLRVIIGDGESLSPADGSITVVPGATATVASGKTWTANRAGFVVNGTLNVNGVLASSASTAISGSGTVVFGGVPSPLDGENETKWWKNAGWTGTVEIKAATNISGTDYAFSNYGNAGSTVKLTNCTGWLKPNYTCVPALEIGGTFSWTDGYSGLNNTFKVATLKGSGTISIPYQGADTAVWQITDDWSGFTGAVVGNNTGAKRVLVFGSTLPNSVEAGEIYISEGATLDLDNASSAWWGVGMKFVVDGTVKATNRSKWGGGTAMTIGDTGVLEITRSDSATSDDGGTNYGNVTGTGTIKFSGSGYTVLSQSIPTSLTFAAEKANGSVVPVAGATIGSLTGSKGFRSDWGSGNRYLTIKQSKDTAWDGSINVDGAHRLTGVIVDPGESTTGTLTLTATQTASSTLTVNGSVNLTGTWVGATTVAGTFGGTGTLTGDLTFNDGATFKANTTALTVSGNVTIPDDEGESLTIDATGLTADEVTILSSESISTKTDVSKVTVDGLYTVEAVADALKLVSTKVAVTIPAIANATVTVSVGGETIGTEAGTYKVAPDAVVTATYAAAEGYEISGQTVYTIDVANSETTFDPAETTEVKQYVAYVVFQVEQGNLTVDSTNYYTTVAVAIDAAKALKKTVVLIAQPEETDTYNISAGETINIKKGEFTFNGIIFPEGAQYNNTTTEIAGVTQYKCTTYTATVQYPGQEPEGVSGQLMQILGGLYTSYQPAYAGTVVTVLDGSDATSGDAMPEVFTYNSEAHTYTLKTMVASYNNGYTTTYYPTLATAFENVPTSGTVTLLSSVTLDATVAVSKTLTLDLNGYTITASGIDAITSSGALTIQGSSDSISVTSGNSVVLTDAAATLTVTSGVTLSPAPTTTLTNKRVVSQTADGTTTYRVIIRHGSTLSFF